MPYVARRRVLVLVGDDGRRSAIVRSLEDAELDVQVYELRDAVEELRGEHVVPGLVVLDWH
ncbi:MAG TPA: hypothetical protein VK427_23265, partial [Kofleriaceae bacterium]|nr:hypothetical protein [Kofleriaceae bacterium]